MRGSLDASLLLVSYVEIASSIYVAVIMAAALTVSAVMSVFMMA